MDEARGEDQRAVVPVVGTGFHDVHSRQPVPCADFLDEFDSGATRKAGRHGMGHRRREGRVEAVHVHRQVNRGPFGQVGQECTPAFGLPRRNLRDAPARCLPDPALHRGFGADPDLGDGRHVRHLEQTRRDARVGVPVALEVGVHVGMGVPLHHVDGTPPGVGGHQGGGDRVVAAQDEGRPAPRQLRLDGGGVAGGAVPEAVRLRPQVAEVGDAAGAVHARLRNRVVAGPVVGPRGWRVALRRTGPGRWTGWRP